jgi:hypothetical protein
MTVGWILDRLPDRPRLAGTIAWTLGVSSTIEVSLITVQAWRGEASHFNVFEETNATIFALMGAMVGIMSLCLFAVLIWAIVRRPVDPLVSWAVIAGMVLVVAGLGIGFGVLTRSFDSSTTSRLGRWGIACLVKHPHIQRAAHGFKSRQRTSKSRRGLQGALGSCYLFESLPERLVTTKWKAVWLVFCLVGTLPRWMVHFRWGRVIRVCHLA